MPLTLVLVHRESTGLPLAQDRCSGDAVDLEALEAVGDIDVNVSPHTRGMTQNLVKYIEAGKALDVDERIEAAHQLLLSVDHDETADQAAIDAAWGEVIERRVSEILNGTAKLVDGREAHAQVRAEIAASMPRSTASSTLRSSGATIAVARARRRSTHEASPGSRLTSSIF